MDAAQSDPCQPRFADPVLEIRRWAFERPLPTRRPASRSFFTAGAVRAAVEDAHHEASGTRRPPSAARPADPRQRRPNGRQGGRRRAGGTRGRASRGDSALLTRPGALGSRLGGAVGARGRRHGHPPRRQPCRRGGRRVRGVGPPPHRRRVAWSGGGPRMSRIETGRTRRRRLNDFSTSPSGSPTGPTESASPTYGSCRASAYAGSSRGGVQPVHGRLEASGLLAPRTLRVPFLILVGVRSSRFLVRHHRRS